MLGPVANLLVRALAVLERDELRAFTHLSEALGSRRIALAIDDEEFCILGDRRPILVAGSGGDVCLRAERAVILDLIDGRTNFLDAVLARRIRVSGAPADLLAVARAQRAFIEGAVRARRVRPLLDEWRAAAAG